MKVTAAVCMLLVVMSPLMVESLQLEAVIPISNPHIPKSGVCSAQTIDPTQIIAAPMATQTDTFLGLHTVKIMGIPVPLYRFKQPSRLSELELPFKLLLLRHVPMDSLTLLQVPRLLAEDSWFPGYRWSVAVCESCGGKGDSIHIGWQFTHINGGDTFFALIVMSKQTEAEGARSGLMALADVLQIGQVSPQWVLALLTVTTLAVEGKP